ncbi:MAG: hotdog fold thioesterase [Actinobacteria bacterium]|nr:hotdog fold thioesterase [Actinomycetota bacterium]
MPTLTAAIDGDLVGKKLGVKVLEASSTRIVATMPVVGNTQPFGLLHGGASVALAESLGSYGAALHAGPGKAIVGLDINATHHRAGRSGLVTGVATALALGRTIVSYEVVVSDEEGKRLCTARITCMIRELSKN